MAATSSPGGAFGVEPHVWRIASVTILGSIMSVLDATVVNVALESLGRDLGSGLAAIQWTVTGYMLALAAVIPIAGWVTRRFGARQVYLASILTFSAGSILCGIAWSTESLIAFRIVQGVGGGLLMPVGQMLVARAAGPERMGRVMSVLAVPIVLAPVLGPAFGGLLIEAASWRWIFLINVPVGAVAFLLGLRRLPRTATEPAGRLDVRGLALLAVGLPALVYGLAELGQGRGADVAHVLLPVGGGLLLVAGFVRHALRADHPILDVRLFSSSAFAAAASATFVLGAVLFGAMLLVPLFFQTVHGESAAMTGLLIAPQGVGAALAMPISGVLTDRLGGGVVAFAGMLVIGLATLPFVLIDETTSYLVTSLALGARGIGMGIAIMPAMAAAYAVLRRDQIADATPQLNVLQRVGGSLGIALFAVILDRQLRSVGADDAHGTALAYAHAYRWVVVATAVGLLPAAVLLRVERATRRRALATAGAPGGRGDGDPA